MKKKLLSLVLTAALVLSVAPAALAKPADVPEKEKAAVLREMEIMVGDEKGDLHLGSTITRAEFTKLLVCASPLKDMVASQANTDPYPDVSHRAWYAPYVRAAVDGNLVQGDLEGFFRPDRDITLSEGVTMALRLLGYADGDFTAPWPAGQLALYRSTDLDEGVAAQNGGDTLTRRDCLHLFYNLLCTPTKTGVPYGQTLGRLVNQSSEVDVPALFEVEQEGPIPLTDGWEKLLPFAVSDALLYRDGDRAEVSDLRAWDLLYWAKDQAILFAFSGSQSSMGQMSAAVEGPVVAEGSWQGKLPFTLAEAASVSRNGAAASPADILPGDVVYWSKYGKSLYVYRSRANGTVEGVAPSPAAPTAVILAGRSYPLETFEAQYAFSDLGAFHKGDAVTLLMGRTGGVAAVRKMEETAVQIGIVTAAGAKTYTDRSGNPYSAKTVTLTAADGCSYTYPWPGDAPDEGDLVSVTLDGASVKVAKLAASSLTGQVSADAVSIGDIPLSPDAHILDTYGDKLPMMATVFPSRLAGVKLTDKMVRAYTIDPNGVITDLILNDVTGDLHQYGVLTDKETVNLSIPTQGILMQGVYTVDLMGTQQAIPVQNKSFTVEKGPASVAIQGTNVRLIKSLTKLSGAALSGQTVTAGGKSWPLADGAAFYLYSKGDKTYTYVTREQLLAAGGALSAWYDKTPEAGGRVRVMLSEVD